MIDVRGGLTALALLATALTLPAGAAEEAFPPAEPASVGIPDAALSMLSERVAAFVEREEIVGGELHVIKQRRTVLRQAYGWKDRDEAIPLETDAIYCVRSMTKPLVGTAIQLLIDEGKLTLDTPVHTILPAFAAPGTRAITVDHLLTHTGGFPFTTLTKGLAEYAGIAEVAAEAAGRGVDFEPGSSFAYSDAGSDTLGAIVAEVSGMAPDRFIRKRILEPLGMRDSLTLLEGSGEAVSRIPSAYSGGTGSWERHWSPADPPLFPFFLTSQSLYATTSDYARFLTLWMDGGVHDGKRLLSPEAIARGLTPRNEIDLPRGFRGREIRYGQQWLLYTSADDPEAAPIFGHSGSDGTYAWAWPELDLIVLFFTQSRGSLAGMTLEPLLQTLLVEQRLDDPSLVAREPDPRELEQAAGLYWDETNEAAYYVVYPRGQRLVMERPGKMQLAFKPTDTPGRWVHEIRQDIRIELVRDERGAINAMRTDFRGSIELQARHTLQENLPTVEQVVAKLREHHGLDRLAEVGPVRLRGTIKIEARGVEGTVETLFDRERSRTEMKMGGSEQRVVTDGERAWSFATTTGVDELEGLMREQALLGHHAAQFDDWREHYARVEVLRRIVRGERSVLLLRAVPREAPGATFFVDETSGRLFRVEALAQLPGMGLVGVRHDFAESGDVGGMRLPFKRVSTFASPLIGRIVTQFEQAESGVEIAADAFAAPE